MSIQANSEERATILAALRHWNRRAVRGATALRCVDEYEIATSDGAHAPLYGDEIEALCERISNI